MGGSNVNSPVYTPITLILVTTGPAGTTDSELTIELNSIAIDFPNLKVQLY